MARDDGDLINHLEDTLASLGMFDDSVRATIVREMRSAILRVDDDAQPARVHVLDGGRGPRGTRRSGFGEPMTDEELLAEEEADRAAAPRFEVFDRDDEPPEVTVRVFHTDAEPPLGGYGDTLAPARAKTLRTGHLRLPADPDVWQTLLHGRSVTAYRVHCDRGELHVAADGELVARLEEGQSADVEGAVLRVRACGEEPARGRFHRLG